MKKINQYKKKVFAVIILGVILFGALAAISFFQSTHLASTQDKLSLTSPAPAPQRFILTGDTGSGSPNQFAVASAMATHCQTEKNCTAAFILGDVFYEAGVKSVDDPQFTQKFEVLYQPVHIPFYIVYGNHDYLGCRECYLQYTSHSSIWKMPAAYYAQNFSSVSFFIIDTEKFNLEQQVWLKEALEQSTAKWKIVLGHRPIESTEVTKVNEDWGGRAALKDIVCHNADFYIAGHAHILEDRGVISGCEVKQVVGGAGGAELRTSLDPNQDLFYRSTYGFISLLVDEHQADVQFVDTKNTKIYENLVEK
jgi:tartrate-resistant acid phosphatase type 5